MYDYLFYNKGDLSTAIEHQRLKIKKEIESQQSDYILNVNEEDYINYIYNKYIINEIKLNDELMNIIEQREKDIDISHECDRAIFDRSRHYYVKGLSITIGIPISGDKELFYLRPSTFSSVTPRGMIQNNELLLTYEGTNLTDKQIKDALNKDVNLIKEYISWVNEDIKPFNDGLKEFILNLLSIRKSKLLKDLNLISSLGIPLRKNVDFAKTYVIPTNKKVANITKPIVKDKTFSPEPSIDMSTYEDIINTLDNMSIIMERCPEAFDKMNEESLRQHFLVQLNGIYEGKATGETFNANGKTDILIRENGKNVFIGECKFWRGDKVFNETINQILSYMCWRDTKGAILIFNKNKNFSIILDKIPELVKLHPNYKKEITLNNETHFRYIFRQPNDENREILLTIMAFDIPSGK
ncbi:MAG: hypothetical protein VB130_08650 [Clostridium sp.]|nr:hypothetical protein [Clostridium sp.]